MANEVKKAFLRSFLGCCTLFVVLTFFAYSVERYFFPEHGLFGNHSSVSFHILFSPMILLLNCFGERGGQIGILLSILIGGALVFLLIPGFARTFRRIGKGAGIYAKRVSCRTQSPLSRGTVRAISLVVTLALWALILLGTIYYLIMLAMASGLGGCPDCFSRNWWKVLLAAAVFILSGVPGARLFVNPSSSKAQLLISLSALVSLLFLFSPLLREILF